MSKQGKDHNERQITVKTSAAATIEGDTLLCFVRGGDGQGPPATQDCQGVPECVAGAYLSGDFSGKKDQVLVCYPAGLAADGKLQRVVLVGLGELRPGAESWRQAGGTAMAALLKTRTVATTVLLPEEMEETATEIAAPLCEGMLLAAYRFGKYRSAATAPSSNGADKASAAGTEDSEPNLRRLIFKGPRGIAKTVKQAAELAAAVCLARDMANEPGNGWTPTDFARQARQMARKQGLKATVLDRQAMEKLGMGGILAVSQGSEQPPSLVVLEYHGQPTSAARQSGGEQAGKTIPTLLLVGKGLTFDSGGISLKPGSGMEEMKYDMCGGAAVLAAMAVVAREQPKGINIVAMIPAAENLPGPAAVKPGDIIRQYGGKTVEVINTDAEGRLLLADALAYGVEKFKPAAVIDLATLTGAVIVALGHHRAGLLGNDDELCCRLLEAGERAGEPLWRLPLGQEYRKQLKSKVADLKNVDKRDAGTILGAVFLEEFVGQTPWVHLDIAGTAWNYTEKSYVPKGPSGFGVRTLVELIRHWR
ncbi:leucyl aminopeptidase [Desulfurivibrio alkaliphilus]|uniref:Probable cytosol aminopeptidase n=1 Tax=Desulfurivibrio alkaliphilus (strain DSM 19089 / UNIQEM U267 / AHT2) TaxID=589865 RepID=D6Z206_DESAT|nr:leucyl aminopeptidase [Desulfurivibrio alkaliphilus]ADH85581.1 Leucyl aminopeptidase [Desulfurivibrio alkaliphilus AHT 2]